MYTHIPRNRGKECEREPTVMTAERESTGTRTEVLYTHRKIDRERETRSYRSERRRLSSRTVFLSSSQFCIHILLLYINRDRETERKSVSMSYDTKCQYVYINKYSNSLLHQSKRDRAEEEEEKM